MSGGGVPLLPGVDVLAQRAVTAARHVGQHAVKLHQLQTVGCLDLQTYMYTVWACVHNDAIADLVVVRMFVILRYFFATC